MVDVDPAHLDRPFDYRIPDGVTVAVGQGVKVTFHGRRRRGWVVGTATESDVDPERLLELTPWGNVPWFDDEDLRLYSWVARRYAAPLAHVLRHAIPRRVAAVEKDMPGWGSPATTGGESPRPIPEKWSAAWDNYDAAPMLTALLRPTSNGRPPAFWFRSLPGDDADALIMELVSATVRSGRGAVVLSPDPRSPLVTAAQAAFGSAVADHRSARTDRTRYRAFLRGRTGHARIAVGERSGVFAPVPALGLIVIDDEASGVWKEQRSPRHHARDVALARARFANAVCVLRSDLPSAALWRLLEAGHVTPAEPDRGVERTRRPRVDVVDLGSPKPGVRRARMSTLATRALADVVASGGRAVVLASRGGTGAALACTRCGQRRECPVCAGSVRPAVTQSGTLTCWECPGCGWSGPAFRCAVCAGERTAPLAAGAGRLATELARSHRGAEVIAMEGFNAPGPTRAPAIAVMTRGSVVDEPVWLAGQGASLVVAPDADGMLSRPSVDAAEDSLRLWFAAARLAGRMILQTREPDHSAVQALVRWDPGGYWSAEAPRRAELGFPPATSLIKVTTPIDQGSQVEAELKDALPSDDSLLGPTPEGAWIIKSARLWATIPAIYALRQEWDRTGRGVRVDVDPVADI